MKYHRYAAAALALASVFQAFPVHAEGCYEDPIIPRSGQVKVIVGARVRSDICMGSMANVMTTLPVGTVVALTAETDGWLKVRTANGIEGWVGAQLLAMTGEPLTPAKPIAPVTPPPAVPTPSSIATPSVTITGDVRMKTIRAVNMRTMGSLRGRILRTLKGNEVVTYLGTSNGWNRVRDAAGAEGFISASYLRKTVDAVVAAPVPAALSPFATPTPAPAPTISIPPATNQQGIVPAGIDLAELNRYWLDKVNALRRAKGLRELVLDQHFIATATEYAGYMGLNRVSNHERADGKTMHQWIGTKGLPFTVRYSTDGWRTNYFTENISWNQIGSSMEDAKRALDQTMSFYLGEAAANGPHYRTTYHADWNSVGAGFYFEDLGGGRYRFTQVFHYGSLVQ